MARPRGKRLVQERQRKEAEQMERKRASDRRKLVLIAIAAIGVMGLAVGWIFLAPDAPWVVYDSVGNDHITGIGQPHAPYNSSPPSSGPHLGNLVGWQEHEQVIPPEVVWRSHTTVRPVATPSPTLFDRCWRIMRTTTC